MAGLSWMLRISCLLATLLGIWTLGIEANLINQASCVNLRQYNSHGRIEGQGNYYDKLEDALIETAYMTNLAHYWAENIARDRGSWFDKMRIKLSFSALQGRTHGSLTHSRRWNIIYSKDISSFRHFFTFVINKS